ncbi:MAG: EcsC family protein [Thiohalocapsa sp.]|nr:EcsC family protein [Thiohalocapsa sp.]MCF7990795.1 EcsC family protein [Thiohalocapsa sp.]
MTSSASPLIREDLLALQWAADHLEHPSLAARLSSVVGTPLEMATKLLPPRLYRGMQDVAERAIERAATLAITSLHESARHSTNSNAYYTGLVATTGALGGGLGIGALLVELPITTTIMLRAIADEARRQGEDLRQTETRLACMEVFALGGHAQTDDAAETGYYGIRLALSLSVSSALTHVSEHGLKGASAPMIVGLARAIAARFGITVSQKAAAQAVPLIGAAGGAAVNTIFMSHYQTMARGHFIVRRLERKYGADVVKAEYERLEEADNRAGAHPGSDRSLPLLAGAPDQRAAG